jgi:hypothetical protein
VTEYNNVTDLGTINGGGATTVSSDKLDISQSFQIHLEDYSVFNPADSFPIIHKFDSDNNGLMIYQRVFGNQDIACVLEGVNGNTLLVRSTDRGGDTIDFIWDSSNRELVMKANGTQIDSASGNIVLPDLSNTAITISGSEGDYNEPFGGDSLNGTWNGSADNVTLEYGAGSSVNRLLTESFTVSSQAQASGSAELTGQVTLNGSPVQGAVVYAFDNTDKAFVGNTTTDSNGNYKIIPSKPVAGNEVLIGVDHDTGSGRFGEEKSTIV